jgi:hypothetical protein
MMVWWLDYLKIGTDDFVHDITSQPKRQPTLER